jgi:hypothetical protein
MRYPASEKAEIIQLVEQSHRKCQKFCVRGPCDGG